MNTRMIVVLMTLALQLMTVAASASQPDELPPGMGKYVMELWEPGTPMPGSNGRDHVRTVEEPDIAKLGGRELDRKDNHRVIILPLAAASALRRHHSVMYLQRLWNGESLDGWNESAPSNANGRFET